jgi:hypothetical protein
MTSSLGELYRANSQSYSSIHSGDIRSLPPAVICRPPIMSSHSGGINCGEFRRVRFALARVVSALSSVGGPPESRIWAVLSTHDFLLYR